MFKRQNSHRARIAFERAFAPLACSYRHDQTSVQVRVYERETDQTHLIVAGIPLSDIATSQAIAQLVRELQHELDFTVLKRY